MPRDPKWFATPQALRKRKKLTVTLSDKALNKLRKLAKDQPGGQSGVIEELILRA